MDIIGGLGGLFKSGLTVLYDAFLGGFRWETHPTSLAAPKLAFGPHRSAALHMQECMPALPLAHAHPDPTP